MSCYSTGKNGLLRIFQELGVDEYALKKTKAAPVEGAAFVVFGFRWGYSRSSGPRTGQTLCMRSLLITVAVPMFRFTTHAWLVLLAFEVLVQ